MGVVWRHQQGWGHVRIGAALVLAAMAGCSTQRPPQLDARQVHRFESQGYPSAAPVAFAQADDVQMVGGLPAHLAWAWPQSPGPHPVVLCLPGLGQGPQAMAPLRLALAEAGYVVLSWQVRGEDEPPVRGDPMAAASHYGPSALQARLDRAVTLLSALRAGQLTPPGLPSAQLDTRHMAVLGYELGAQTAQALAGEQVSGVTPPPAWAQATQGVRAWLLISPHASFALGALDTRFKPITQPVLVLTSDADGDATGQVGAPYLRTAAYAGLGSADKAMLLLHGAGHGALGQREPRDVLGSAGDDVGPGGRPQGGERGDGASDGRGPSGGGGGKRAGRSQGGGRGADGGDSKGPGGAGGANLVRSPTTEAMQRQAMQDVSLAFLDAHLRDDTLARRWLAQSVGKWVAPVGEWLLATNPPSPPP